MTTALLSLPTVAVFVLFLIIPTGATLIGSLFGPELTLKNFSRFFGVPLYVDVLLSTVILSSLVTLACAVIGYATAYAIHLCPAAIQKLMLFLTLITFWTSILIRSYAWMIVLSREGLLNNFLVSIGIVEDPISFLYNRITVFCALLQILLPLMILSCHNVMQRIDPSLTKAARILGASPLRAFTSVFFPLSKSGVGAASLLVFVLSMGTFVTPALLGGTKDIFIANIIEFQMTRMVNVGFSSAIAIVILATVFTVILAALWLANFRLSRGRVK